MNELDIYSDDSNSGDMCSGITWTSRASGTTTDLYAVISGLAQYVAVGSGGVTINSQ